MIKTKTKFKTYKEALNAVGTAYERALDLCKGVDNHEAVEAGGHLSTTTTTDKESKND